MPESGAYDARVYEQALGYARRIVAEIERLGERPPEPSPEALESQAAFMADRLSLFQWLQYVLAPRIEQIAREGGRFPASSQVGAYAAREWDGYWEAAPLVSLLREFDAFMEGLEDSERKAPARVVEMPRLHIEPIGLGGSATSDAARVVADYLRALPLGQAARYHAPNPIPPSGRDTQLAEQVFATVREFLECFGEVEEAGEGPVVNAIVRAERGLWPVRVACSRRPAVTVEEEILPGYFRPTTPARRRACIAAKLFVEPNLSLLRTTDYYLRLHDIHPAFSGERSARGCVMEFWNYLATNRKERARELLTPDSRDVELPACGQGWVDEIVAYIDHQAEEQGVAVRVLINTRDESRFCHTLAVHAGGRWWIDWRETLRRNKT
jgi:uncharacterized protein YqcC (DUF446 family)